MLHVVLYQPEIPHNTGAVGRLCLATGARLHLIKPLGFSLDDSHLKRAGLDYWREVDVRVWESWDDLRREAGADVPWYFLTTKTRRIHWNAMFPPECYLVFGPETRGLPESLLTDHAEDCLRIPMEGTRSLNLSTSVAIILYEALRQQISNPSSDVSLHSGGKLC
jgi:tRNA (cytidine/uridine-2'-O-)-methyltransferase